MKKIIASKLLPLKLKTTKDYEVKLRDFLSDYEKQKELLKFLRSLAKFEFNYLSEKMKTFLSLYKKEKDWSVLSFYFKQIITYQGSFREKLNLTKAFITLTIQQIDELSKTADTQFQLEKYVGVNHFLQNISHSLDEFTTISTQKINHSIPYLLESKLDLSATLQTFLQKSELLDDFLMDIELREKSSEKTIFFVNLEGFKEENNKIAYLMQLTLLLHNHLEYTHTKMHLNSQSSMFFDINLMCLEQAQLQIHKEKQLKTLEKIKELIILKLESQASILVDNDINCVNSLHWISRIQEKDNLLWKLKIISILGHITFNDTTLRDFFEQERVTFNTTTKTANPIKLSSFLTTIIDKTLQITVLESISQYKLSELEHTMKLALKSIDKFSISISSYKAKGDVKKRKQLSEDQAKLLMQLNHLKSKLEFYLKMISIWNIIDETTFSNGPKPELLLEELSKKGFINENRLCLKQEEYQIVLSDPKLQLTQKEKTELSNKFNSITRVSLPELESLKDYSSCSLAVLKKLKSTIHTHPPTNLKECLLTLISNLTATTSKKEKSDTTQDNQIKDLLEYLKVIFKLKLNSVQSLLETLGIDNPITKKDFLIKTLDLLISCQDLELSKSEIETLTTLKDQLSTTLYPKTFTKKIDLQSTHGLGVKYERNHIVEQCLDLELLQTEDDIEQENKKKKAKKKKTSTQTTKKTNPDLESTVKVGQEKKEESKASIKKQSKEQVPQSHERESQKLDSVEATEAEHKDIQLKQEKAKIKSEKKAAKKANKAAITIQSIYRGQKDRKKTTKLINERKKAAILIQSVFRSKNTKKEVLILKEKFKNAATLIQSMARTKNAKTEMLKLKQKNKKIITKETSKLSLHTKTHPNSSSTTKKDAQLLQDLQITKGQITYLSQSYNLKIGLSKIIELEKLLTSPDQNKFLETPCIYPTIDIESKLRVNQTTFKTLLKKQLSKLVVKSDMLMKTPPQNILSYHHYHQLISTLKEISILKDEYTSSQYQTSFTEHTRKNISETNRTISSLQSKTQYYGFLREWEAQLEDYKNLVELILDQKEKISLNTLDMANKLLFAYLTESKALLTGIEKTENHMAIQHQLYMQQLSQFSMKY